MEALESRLLLSGDVGVSVAGGALVLTGDAQDTSIVVDQLGLAADQLRVSSGELGTTVNGGINAIIVDGITAGVQAAMGDGADMVIFRDAAITGSVNVSGGSGNKNVGFENTTVIGNVTFANGTGVHVASFLPASVVTGSVTLQSAGDTNALIAVSSSFHSITMHSDSGITLLGMGAGSMVAGDIKLTGGDGGSIVGIDDTRVGGNLSVTQGIGLDLLYLTGGTTVLGNVTLNAGDGGTVLDIESSSVAKNLTVTATTGSGSLEILNGASVGGNVVATYGYGGTTTFVLDGTVRGNFTINAHEGDDTFAAADSSFGGNVTITDGNGDTVTGLFGTTVHNDFTVRAGTGDDIINVDATSDVGGNLNASFGAGTLANNVDPTAVDGNVTVK